MYDRGKEERDIDGRFREGGNRVYISCIRRVHLSCFFALSFRVEGGLGRGPCNATIFRSGVTPSRVYGCLSRSLPRVSTTPHLACQTYLPDISPRSFPDPLHAAIV